MRTINYTYVTEEQNFQATAAAALPGHGFCHMAELLEEQATEERTYQATAAAVFLDDAWRSMHSETQSRPRFRRAVTVPIQVGWHRPYGVPQWRGPRIEYILY